MHKYGLILAVADTLVSLTVPKSRIHYPGIQDPHFPSRDTVDVMMVHKYLNCQAERRG